MITGAALFWLVWAWAFSPSNAPQGLSPWPGGLKGYGGGGGCYANNLVLTSSLVSARHNFTSELGFVFTVGGSDITVNCLGRYVSGPTHSHSHTIRIRDNSDAVVTSVVIDVTSGTIGTWMFSSVTPVTLTAGSTYRLTSPEVDTEDDWQEQFSFTYPAAINSVVSTFGSPGSWTNVNGSQQYAGVDLKYQ